MSRRMSEDEFLAWMDGVADGHRQLDLTRSLGQVTCLAPEGHDFYVALGRACDYCGAAY